MKWHMVFMFIIIFAMARKFSFGQNCKTFTDSTIKVYKQKGPAAALALAQKACTTCSTEGNTINYINSLRTLATVTSELNHIQEALNLYRLALKQNKLLKKDDDRESAFIMSDIAELLVNEDSVQYYTINGRKIIEKTEGKKTFDYVFFNNQLARAFVRTGDLDAAEALTFETLKIEYDLPNGKTNKTTLQTMAIGAVILTEKGDYELAIQINEYLSGIYKEQYNNDPVSYLSVRNNLANIYYNFGQYEKAVNIFSEITGLMKSRGNIDEDYLIVLQNLASCLSDLQESDKALVIDDQIIAVSKQNNDLDTYGAALNNKGFIYAEKKDWQNANINFEQALAIREKLFTKNNSIYIENLDNLASCYRESGQFEKASTLAEEALKLSETLNSRNNPAYGTQLQEAGLSFWSAEKNEKAGTLFKAAYENLKQQIKNNFFGFNEKDRESFLDNFYTRFQLYASFTYDRNIAGDHSFNGWLYDTELSRKGLLLSSSQLFQNTIKNSGDTLTQKRFLKWKKLKSYLSGQYNLPAVERNKDVDSLNSVSETLERTLAYKSPEFKSQVIQKDISWRDIKYALKKNEAAVEFIKFDYYNGKTFTDNIYFAALLIRNDSQNPILVKLFDYKQFEALVPDKSIDDDAKIAVLYGKVRTEKASPLYRLVWEPLKKHLADITTIYFAPSSILNNIAFSAIKSGTNRYLIEDYNLIQLNSTREVTQGDSRGKLKLTLGMKVALFGGINYNVSSPILQERKKTTGIFSSGPKRYQKRDNAVENWEYLSGTQTEVDLLDKICREGKMDVVLFTGANATEEDFKSFSGDNCPDILHIATHGFYYDRKPSGFKNLITISVKQNIRYNDDPLVRSGLVLANANQVWNGRPIPPGREDGILTGSELAGLNFSKSKLVVLSACRTGLGDLNGDESAYGLQRAFKLAGAQNTIMSLWRISDAKTSDFMKLFYKHLTDGSTIRDAYRKTQLAMCKSYDPYYWGAFVLAN